MTSYVVGLLGLLLNITPNIRERLKRVQRLRRVLGCDNNSPHRSNLDSDTSFFQSRTGVAQLSLLLLRTLVGSLDLWTTGRGGRFILLFEPEPRNQESDLFCNNPVVVLHGRSVHPLMNGTPINNSFAWHVGHILLSHTI